MTNNLTFKIVIKYVDRGIIIIGQIIGLIFEYLKNHHVINIKVFIYFLFL